jgi:hypothetical protein
MTTRAWRSDGRGSQLLVALGAVGSLAMTACCRPSTLVKDLAPGMIRGAANHTYTFKFTENPGKSCTIEPAGVETPTPCAEHKDCARASRGKGETIAFAATTARDFEIVFDPFRRGGFHIHGAGLIKLDPEAPASPAGKPYSFSVVSKGCDPLDPWIIVNP